MHVISIYQNGTGCSNSQVVIVIIHTGSNWCMDNVFHFQINDETNKITVLYVEHTWQCIIRSSCGINFNKLQLNVTTMALYSRIVGFWNELSN